MKTSRIERMSFVWNAVYAGFSALQSSVILFVVSRVNDITEAGIITFGFAIANLIMILGGYGIRNYQVTDVKEEYHFSDYYHVRIVTVAGSALLMAVYLLFMILSNKYDLHKSIIVFEIVLLKLVDAFEGVYVGRLQQKGRLDIGSIIASIRLIVSTIIIFIMLWIVTDVVMSLFAGLIASVLLEIGLLIWGKRYDNFSVNQIEIKKIKKILMMAFPLCMGMVLHNYIGNAPKYLVDLYMTDDIQAVSGYIMMPMFVITILNAFLMQPTVKKTGDIWGKGEKEEFRKLIARHLMIISILATFVMAVGVIIGLPVLSWLFNTELGMYWKEFLILMAGGTFYTYAAYFIVLLTTMRKQKVILYGCLTAFVILIAFGRISVSSAGLAGAALLYIVANLAMVVIYGVSINRNIQKHITI